MKMVIKVFLAVFVPISGFVLVWFEFPFIVPPFQYLLFVHRSHAYYLRIASACASVLDAHHVSSNDVVNWTPDATERFQLRLSGGDQSLPLIIRRLNPDFVLVGTNWVTISIPPEEGGGFGIIWTQSDEQTDHWDLQAGEGEMTTVCSH
jgi:hypothetical protein